jgi:hypothetical protein
MVRRENPPPRRQLSQEKFFRCPFQYPKVPLEAGAPPSPPNLLMLPTPLLPWSFIRLIWRRILIVNFVNILFSCQSRSNQFLQIMLVKATSVFIYIALCSVFVLCNGKLQNTCCNVLFILQAYNWKKHRPGLGFDWWIIFCNFFPVQQAHFPSRLPMKNRKLSHNRARLT